MNKRINAKLPTANSPINGRSLERNLMDSVFKEAFGRIDTTPNRRRKISDVGLPESVNLNTDDIISNKDTLRKNAVKGEPSAFAGSTNQNNAQLIPEQNFGSPYDTPSGNNLTKNTSDTGIYGPGGQYDRYGKDAQWWADQGGSYDDIKSANNFRRDDNGYVLDGSQPSIQSANPAVNSINNDLGGFESGYTMSGNSASLPGSNNPSSFNGWQSNPDAYDIVSESAATWDPSTWGSTNESISRKFGYDPVTGLQTSEQSLLDTQANQASLMDSERLKNQAIADNVGTSWNDWANIGLGTMGVGMQAGLYGERKDYLQGTNDALAQATQNSEEAHNAEMQNTASYGSAFSQA